MLWLNSHSPPLEQDRIIQIQPAAAHCAQWAGLGLEPSPVGYHVPSLDHGANTISYGWQCMEHSRQGTQVHRKQVTQQSVSCINGGDGSRARSTGSTEGVYPLGHTGT